MRQNYSTTPDGDQTSDDQTLFKMVINRPVIKGPRTFALNLSHDFYFSQSVSVYLSRSY